MTEIEFQKLPKNEQQMRWEIFLESNGYEKELSKEKIEEIKAKYLEGKQND
jgi:hypothetical protein